MRLRLTVERHLLPSVRLLWDVTPSTAPGAGLTVSQFLDQVNEIVQLEADEWGLEDYAVEVQGFECLHFSEIHRLLKEDDEVRIRPLQTPDLRARKISGRHQITEDGRHLVDGVAFGRALLRKPSRPAIHIPPRKRRRLLTNEDEDDSLLPQPIDQQIVLRSQSDDLLDTNLELDEESSDDEQDSDFLDEEGLDDEIQDIRNQDMNGLGLILNADGTPCDDFEDEEEEDQLNGSFRPQLSIGPTRSAGRRLLKARETSRSTAASGGANADKANARERRASSGSNKSVRFEDEETGTPATTRLSQDSEDEESDGDFQPEDNDISDKENAPPGNNGDETSSSEEDESDSDSASSSSVSVSADDETSSSGSSSSSSDADSESEPEETSSKRATPSKKDAEASSSDTTSSESSSESDTGAGAKQPHISPTTSVDDVAPKAAKTVQQNKPDGTGTRNTKARNKRRVSRALLNRLLKSGDLPPDSTVEDAVRWKEARRKAKVIPRQSASARPQDGPSDIEARRGQLLEAIQNGGVDLDEDLESSKTSPKVQETSSETLKGDVRPSRPELAATQIQDGAEPSLSAGDPTSVVQVPDSLDRMQGAAEKAAADDSGTTRSESDAWGGEDISQVPASGNPEASMTSKSDEKGSSSSARRSRLDLAGSKRLLFGSLGLRTPKTKEDGVKLQEKLMNSVKPARKPDYSAKTTVPAKSNLTAEGDESWRDKIELSAVECWDYGVVLSEPPFPFVQRWDPQYQRSSGGSKRKQKKRKRNDTSYYENQYDDSFNDQVANKSPRREDYTPVTEEALFDKIANEVDARNGPKETESFESGQDAQASSQPVIRETMSSNNDAIPPAETDLPSLPEDLSTLTALTKDDCKPGAIITFKKFEMELGNEWHPYISEYRTAKIDIFHENGVVDMTYAKRDVPPDQRQYDEVTGERILGKFEMPGYDSDSEEADPSKVSIDYAELIEPLLLVADVAAPSPDNAIVPEANGDAVEEEQSPLEVVKETQSLVVERHDDGHIEMQQVSETQHASQSSDLEYHDAETSKDLESSLHAKDNHEDTPTPADVIEDSQPQAQPNTQTREDMSQVFRDAGWRSSIGPDIRRLLQLEQEEPIAGHGDPEDFPKNDAPSPSAFNGFSSPQQSHKDEPDFVGPVTQSTTHQTSGQLPESAERENSTNESALLRTEHSIEYPALPDMDDESLHLSQHSATPSSAQPVKSSPPPISPPSIKRQAPTIVKADAQAELESQADGASEKMGVKEDSQTYTFLSDASISSEEFPEIFSQSFERRLSEQPVPAPVPPPKKPSASPKASQISATNSRIKRESTRSTSPLLAPPIKKESKTSRARKLFSRPSFQSLRPSSSQGDSKGGKKSKNSSQARASASQVTIGEEDSGFDDSFWPRFTQSQPVRGESQRRGQGLTQESDTVDLTISSDGPAGGNDDDVGSYEKGIGDADASTGSLPSGSGWISKKAKGKKAGGSFP